MVGYTPLNQSGDYLLPDWTCNDCNNPHPITYKEFRNESSKTHEYSKVRSKSSPVSR